MTWTAVTAKLYLIPSQSFRSTMPTWRCLSSCVTGRNKTFCVVIRTWGYAAPGDRTRRQWLVPDAHHPHADVPHSSSAAEAPYA
jgi:hypothetical protein